jgi:hypothetical protein
MGALALTLAASPAALTIFVLVSFLALSLLGSTTKKTIATKAATRQKPITSGTLLTRRTL